MQATYELLADLFSTKAIGMDILRWLRGSSTSVRRKALMLYEQGMAKARKHDQIGAITDYSRTIDLAECPVDVAAMALFNRALAQIAAGEFGKGVDDLTAVLDMEGAPSKVKKMAEQKLAKRISQSLGNKRNKHTSG